jgi:hypothetical protein
MMNNLDLWNKVKQPPKSALKTIGAGRLKGMTDINPQWRLEAITEHFGQCGIGWYYEIVKMWTESGAGGELMAFVHIHLFTSVKAKDGKDDYWSAPIVGIGGSALVAKESAGLRANDEAYKMALTDALSVAMKQLGFAADIYAGKFDGSKYRDDEVKPKESQPMAIYTVTPEQDLKCKDIAAEIVDFAVKELWDDAFVTYDNVSDHDERIAVWTHLKPNSAIRTKLKIMGEAKRNHPATQA